MRAVRSEHAATVIRALTRGLGLLGCLLLSACTTFGYYGQAVSGQFHILTHRQKIDSLLAAPDTEPALKAQLQAIQAIRTFAAEQLQLPLAGQYSTYVDLQRPYVVWNVFAAPELSLQPLTWCYPVAGCVAYRGYFQEADAQAFAATLLVEGYDVFVGGVAAYSTLGWFSDPVLNTILNRQEHQLASLLFHELAHHVVYIPGDTEFNESFATTVEREGVRRWLQAGMRSANAPGLEMAISQDLARQEQFVALVQQAVADLRILYGSSAAEASKRSGKQERLQQLRSDYADLRRQWQDYSGYDGWFGGELNNAKLGTVVTYNNLVPAFVELLRQSNGDLPVFYARVAALKELSDAQRQARLQTLLAQRQAAQQ